MKKYLKNEKISVNITTYNRAHLLPRCLESVLAQTYENLEIVIVDDCSEDDTEKVVQKYMSKDKGIKYIKHKRNEGLSVARNTACRNSKGYYVAFMDDDDEWIDKDKLKKEVEVFENDKNNNVGIVCSSVRLYKNESEFRDKIIEKPRNIKRWILKRNGIIYSPTVLTKKEILEKTGGFDTNLKRGVDSDFYRSCILRFGYDIHFMKDITTVVHEYGDDRVTPQNNLNSIKKNIQANKYIIIKYFKWFLFYPGCFIFRLKIIATSYLKFIRTKK